MRLRFLFSLIAFTLLISVSSLAAPVLPSAGKHPLERMMEKLAFMKTRDYQALVGHRLSLKEKLLFVGMRARARHYVKKGMTREEITEVQVAIRDKIIPGKREGNSSLGKTSLGFGIAAVITLAVGFFVPGVALAALISSIVAIATGSAAKRRDPSDTAGHTGKLLGWIVLGILLAFLIAAVVIISSWSWW